MAKKEEDQGARLVRYGVGILLGGAVAFAVCLAALLLASVMVSAGTLSEKITGQITTAACVLGAFAGGLLAVRRCGARALVVGLAAGAVLFLLLLTIGTLAFHASPQETGGLTLLGGCLCGGATAGLLGRTARPKKKRRK